MTQAEVKYRRPMRHYVNPAAYLEIAEARRRIALKRWLRMRGCPMPNECPTHILRLIAQRIRAGDNA